MNSTHKASKKKTIKKNLKKHASKSTKLVSIVNFILLFILVASLSVNQVITSDTRKALGLGETVFAQISNTIIGKTSASSNVNLTGDLTQDAINLVISSGVPEVYGPELGVIFDQVQQSMNIMKQYDPTYGKKKITLSGNDQQRYINVGLKISCEYCCGAKAIVFEDGRAACGCAHAIAMRGLIAYLVQNHGNEYSDDEILREIARWKGMYYPKQTIKKMSKQLQSGNYTPEIASLLLGLNLPNYGSGSNSAPIPSEIENLPSMVGGC